MALSSGAITFGQIVNEWSELWYNGKATPSPSNPISMRKFLRGYPIDLGGFFNDPNGYVPDYYTTTGGVPSSGNFSLRTLAGTNAENSADVCLAGFYVNRTYYYRNTGALSS